MLRHHSLGPVELAALMGAWQPPNAAVGPRFRWILALDAAGEYARQTDAACASAPSDGPKEEGNDSRR